MEILFSCIPSSEESTKGSMLCIKSVMVNLSVSEINCDVDMERWW